MSKVIKSRNVEFKPEAIRLPVIVPIIYKESGAAGVPQEDLEKRALAAERMVREAEEKAALIVERAEASARATDEKARADGFRAGRKDGYAEGIAEAESETKGIRAEAIRILEEARAEAARVIAGAGPQILEIAVAVARKVIKREVSADPEVVLANVREALKSVNPGDAVTVTTNPLEVTVVENVRTRLRKEFGGLGDISVRDDPSVDPGGCTIRTDKGTVDARIDSQIQAISERISEVIGERDCDGAALERDQ